MLIFDHKKLGHHRSVFLCFVILLGTACELRADGTDFYERRIRPLFAESCYECHSVDAETLHASLRLDSSSSILHGGDSGPALVPGDPAASLLLQSVRYDHDLQMPPSGRLSDRQIQDVETWIKNGAVMPASSQAAVPSRESIDFEQGKMFWSFQPVRIQQLPTVSLLRWPEQRIDHFVLSKMESNGLQPSVKANKVTLLRRAYLTLLGIPPTGEELTEFLQDDHPLAFERTVDRLLASPQYGEHWARWWLDLARYTDRTASWLQQEGRASLYRDWVVSALNDDLSYDEFVRRQLATDLMNDTGPEDRAALGFLSLSPTYWKELKLPCEIIKVIVADEWEERVDVVSRTFLGLTAACARCHDHKFDPISVEDYHALAGIFASTRQVALPLIKDDLYEPVLVAKKRVAELSKMRDDLKKKKPKPEDEIAQVSKEILELQNQTPYYRTPLVNGLAEQSLYVVRAGATPQDGSRLEYREGPRNLPLFVRGNPNRPGDEVPRRFLRVLGDATQIYEAGSGRLELADSIFNQGRDLAARVVVNRIWLALFGEGIVATPSNFGQQGVRPSHPELLEDLAWRMIQNGWSLKRLHREIVLSATWQQSSIASDESAEVDPENVWLSRMNVRKLTFEQWRDGILSCSDSLNQVLGGESIGLEAEDNFRRTLYATVHRRDMSTTLMVHDFPDPTQHSPMRVETTTPIQGLYALNGPLLLRQATELASRLNRGGELETEAALHRIYGWLFYREPSERELAAGIAFLDVQHAQLSTERWQQYLHVLLASNELMFLD